jgi:hypothetical protein
MTSAVEKRREETGNKRNGSISYEAIRPSWGLLSPARLHKGRNCEARSAPSLPWTRRSKAKVPWQPERVSTLLESVCHILQGPVGRQATFGRTRPPRTPEPASPIRCCRVESKKSSGKYGEHDSEVCADIIARSKATSRGGLPILRLNSRP